ncbi:BatD family protein [Salinicola halimionae]|uniref:BatD family protein n=1 Tax=Salinicola halimionae TaxID=1949081 RepID=UPI000DA1E47C|nr:BatD family protein [Salinicola halimionae]
MNERRGSFFRGCLRLACLFFALGVAPTASAQSQTTPTLAQPLAPQVTATLDPTRVAPGETAQLRVTVLVPTFMPRPVEFPALDQPNLRVQLPERATMPVSRRVDGRTWAGVSRRYQLTPMAAGDFTLGQGALEITFQDPETGEAITRKQTLEQQTLIAAVPEAAAGLSPYIAGTSLTLAQRIWVTRASASEAESARNEADSDETNSTATGADAAKTAETLDRSGEEPISLAIGDSLQREIVATLEGGSALLLPSLGQTVPVANMDFHATSPIVTETQNGGSRTEHLTYIAQHGGLVTLPDITVRWYDLKNRRIVSTSEAGMTIAIEGAPSPSAASGQSLLQYGKLGIAIVLLGVVVGSGWRWLWPFWKRARRQRRLRRERSGIAALRRLERQVRARRYAESLSAWQELLRKAPRLPDSCYREVTRCLAVLGRERYAAKSIPNQPSPNQPDASWRALQQAVPRVADLRQARGEPPLPPLNPRAL